MRNEDNSGSSMTGPRGTGPVGSSEADSGSWARRQVYLNVKSRRIRAGRDLPIADLDERPTIAHWTANLSAACAGFCSRCRKSFSEIPWLAICPTCGDRLIPQGYCPVCEDYWTLPVGVPCPKHDLPLDNLGPPSVQFDSLGKPCAGSPFATSPIPLPPRPHASGWKPKEFRRSWRVSEWARGRCITWPLVASG